MIFSDLIKFDHFIARKSIGALEKTNLDLDEIPNELVLLEKCIHLF